MLSREREGVVNIQSHTAKAKKGVANNYHIDVDVYSVYPSEFDELPLRIFMYPHQRQWQNSNEHE